MKVVVEPMAEGDHGGGSIVCVVTDEEHRNVAGGGVPIFYVRDQAAKERTALLISRTVQGIVQELENGAFLILKV